MAQVKKEKTGNKFIVHGNIIKYPGKKNIDDRGLGFMLFDKMKQFQGNVAQIDGLTGKTETYEVFLKKCIRTAIEMRSRGIKKDDIVTICSYNHMDTYIPEVATFFLGARLANVDPNLSLEDASYLLSMVKPKMIFVSHNAVNLIEKVLKKTEHAAEIVVFGESNNHTKFSEFLKQVPQEDSFLPVIVKPEETVTILFSSGTSGLPKGICLNGKTIMARTFFTRIPPKEGIDVNLTFSSPYWISALIMLSDSIECGTCRLVLQNFDADQFWNIIKKYKVAFLLLTPTQLTQLLKKGKPKDADTSHLRSFGVGGSPLSKEQLQLTRELLSTTFVFFGYGQTELGSGALGYDIFDPNDMELHHNKITSCGRPLPCFEYKVVNPDTEEILGPNQQGELRIKSDYCMMNGYYNVDSKSAWDSDGFLKTGDVAYYDDDYCFYIVDRIKEMLKFQGWQITPAKLEGILLTHPQVESVVVIGIPHPEDGDHPMGVVVLKKSAVGVVTAKEIEKYVEDRVDDKQRLRAGVIIVDKIPLTPSDKLKRNYVRDLVLSGKINGNVRR